MKSTNQTKQLKIYQPRDMKNFQNTFNFFDKNNDGYLNIDELESFLSSICSTVLKENVNKFINNVFIKNNPDLYLSDQIKTITTGEQRLKNNRSSRINYSKIQFNIHHVQAILGESNYSDFKIDKFLIAVEDNLHFLCRRSRDRRERDIIQPPSRPGVSIMTSQASILSEISDTLSMASSDSSDMSIISNDPHQQQFRPSSIFSFDDIQDDLNNTNLIDLDELHFQLTSMGDELTEDEYEKFLTIIGVDLKAESMDSCVFIEKLKNVYNGLYA